LTKKDSVLVFPVTVDWLAMKCLAFTRVQCGADPLLFHSFMWAAACRPSGNHRSHRFKQRTPVPEQGLKHCRSYNDAKPIRNQVPARTTSSMSEGGD